MSRAILIYGQPAAGKSFSLRNLDPETTFIIDADQKFGLPWRGWRKNYNREKQNFTTANTIREIIRTFNVIGNSEKYSHVKTLVIDGLNNTMAEEEAFFDDFHEDTGGKKDTFKKYQSIAHDILWLVKNSKTQRDDLTVVFIAHADVADPNVENSVDKVKTPGKWLEKKGFESAFLYVFYAKSRDGDFYFETCPNNSTARSPLGCFPERVPNDLQRVLDTIENFENGVEEEEGEIENGDD